MPLTAEQQAEVDRQVAERLAKAMPATPAQQQPQMQPQMQGWGQPAGWGATGAAPSMNGAPAAEKVFVPIELVGPDGSKVSCYLQFPGNYAEPTALNGLIGQLVSMGVPVRDI